ncbi:MAG: hypothetical protein DRP18_01115 [Candidatus Aenigmatarchaeota archaeon]|nr:MAG: hypothetical protein DRP18_01115 [Candidatus Aenigmarchaeota archaeon]
MKEYKNLSGNYPVDDLSSSNALGVLLNNPNIYKSLLRKIKNGLKRDKLSGREREELAREIINTYLNME